MPYEGALTSRFPEGVTLPMPTLPLDSVIAGFEVPMVEDPVKTGIVPDVPEPVTVCAAALIANAAMQIVNPTFSLRIFLCPFLLSS